MTSTHAERSIDDVRARLAAMSRALDAGERRSFDAQLRSLAERADIAERSRPIAERSATGAARQMLDLDAGGHAASQAVRAFLSAASHDAALVHGHLSDVLLAQEYQELNGQIIRRVVAPVDDVAGVLAQLVRVSVSDAALPSVLPAPLAGGGFGPAVPHVDSGTVVGAQGDVDALLLEYGR